jgi:hypothetical protein
LVAVRHFLAVDFWKVDFWKVDFWNDPDRKFLKLNPKDLLEIFYLQVIAKALSSVVKDGIRYLTSALGEDPAAQGRKWWDQAGSG